ncbi:unnamed protein product [Discula destructiva]
MEPSSTPNLPAAADHGERMNRMNMLLAKHSSTLSALKRSATANATTPQSPAAKKKAKSTFSALKNSSAAAATPANTTSTSKSSQADNKNNNNDDDDDDALFGSINTGLGFVPAGKEVAADARSAATRDLRGKLLGKRAREQKEDGAAARRKKQGVRGNDDESDEDEGRSKIGKGRKKGRKVAVAEVDE